MARLWVWGLAGLAGLVLGTGSALAISNGALSGGVLGGGVVQAGPWSTDVSIGSTTANPWLRARVARVGLLALSQQETLYFDRTRDDSGAPLRAACRYRLSGGTLPTRWWSITIYGADQFLPRNLDGAGSLDATRALADGAQAWTSEISPVRPASGHWISSAAAGTFSLTLRLYNPDFVDANRLSQLALPKVERLDCKAPATGDKS